MASLIRATARVARKLTRRAGLHFGLRPEKGVEFYDQVFSKSEEYQKPYKESVYFDVWTAIVDRIPADPTVLDIGCGPGQFAEYLHASGVTRYLGFDMSSTAIEAARKRIPAYRFEVDNAYTTSLFDDAEYDLVVCTEVLEHARRDLAILRKIRSGTRVLATVPNFWARGHVRWFRSVDEVRARYSRALDLDVEALPLLDHELFLIDGVRRTV
jgi:SAM-dependent methyltransferase